MKPVSYTHLDVYKRQPYNHPYLKDMKPMSSEIVCKKGENTVFAVSYTHLDVYKRQLEHKKMVRNFRLMI